MVNKNGKPLMIATTPQNPVNCHAQRELRSSENRNCVILRLLPLFLLSAPSQVIRPMRISFSLLALFAASFLACQTAAACPFWRAGAEHLGTGHRVVRHCRPGRIGSRTTRTHHW